MDMVARRELIEKAIALVDAGSTLLAVPLDDFFAGNTDNESIGVNLPADRHIGVDGFRRLLKEIRDRADVQDVFLELGEVPDPDEVEDEEEWPTATAAFIITSAPATEVRDWVARLHPRNVCAGWCVQPGVKTPIVEAELRPGHHPVRVSLL